MSAPGHTTVFICTSPSTNQKIIFTVNFFIFLFTNKKLDQEGQVRDGRGKL